MSLLELGGGEGERESGDDTHFLFFFRKTSQTVLRKSWSPSGDSDPTGGMVQCKAQGRSAA